MQVPSHAQAISIAGSPHAAKRGGALQAGTRSSAAAQSIATSPAGRTAGSDAVDAGDQAGDRNGDGSQPYDTFERRDDAQSIEPVEPVPHKKPVSSRIDYQA